MNLLDGIRQRAWDSRAYDFPASAKAVPTLLTPEEGKMLCWLGEYWYRAEGQVVDLGSFLGGSTVRLASGLERSGRPWTMHSYDRFEIQEPAKEKFLYSAGYERFEGQDMFGVFQKHIGPYSNKVKPHRGDVLNFPWSGEPIELLFIDIAKTSAVNNFILDNFFPALIPGRSIIIQQDYLFFRNPWLIATMEMLRPKIELLSWTRDYSAIFICRERPDRDDLARAKFEALTQQEVDAAICRARDRFPFDYQREMVTAALQTFRRFPKEHRAWAYPQYEWTRQPPGTQASRSAG
jgi:hypothetical protein